MGDKGEGVYRKGMDKYSNRGGVGNGAKGWSEGVE